MPQPRLIDPAVFYDIVKIRRAVDDATEDAVRASTGLSVSQTNTSRLDPFGGGGVVGPKMSKERIFKIRQKAVKLLAKAYTLDEVAASVATMQSTSSLEDVAQHVLKRDKTDIDARYVHFYHEKIPSRMMEQNTPLEPLTDIITSLPWEMQAAPLRTRGLVRIFKHEYEMAANDFTLALHIAQEMKLRHKPGADQLVLAKHFKEEQDNWHKSGKDWRSVPHLKEEEQPSSLEQQLLFNRAGVYLTLACQSVHTALHGLKEHQKKTKTPVDPVSGETPVLSAAEKQAHQVRLDARKKVKTYAKRALKDYVGFLAHFDYTPGLPFEITNEIMRRVYDLANGHKTHPQSSRTPNRVMELSEKSWSDDSPVGDALVKHQSSNQQNGTKRETDADGWPRFPVPQIHPASALFAATPPPGLPEFPSTEASLAQRSQHAHDPLSLGSREAVTYHPLLTDALHSLLLSHSLLQTSPTELLRHAHNVARLARIADGYPIFQAARSPARADWIEVVRRANNWVGLSEPWHKLCQPAPLPTAAGGDLKPRFSPGTEDGQKPDVLRKKPNETPDQKKERIKQQAIMDALGDERVVDEETFQRSVRARERRAMNDEDGLSGPLNDGTTWNLAIDGPAPTNGTASLNGTNGSEHLNGYSTKSPSPTHDTDHTSATSPAPKRWAQDDSKEYPISTERAEAISRWIREAPLSMGGGKKKRTTKKKTTKATCDGNTVVGAMQKLDLDDNQGGEGVD